MITENLSTLKIHKLTQAQYDRELAAGNIDENALYLTPDEEIDLSGYATIEQLDTKANISHSHAVTDITNLQTQLDGKSNTSHTHSAATQSSSGFMSKTDKTKLDDIEEGAQVNTVTGVKGNSESSYRTGNINITKANIGLGSVDNTADSTKSVKYATSAGSATKSTQDASGNTITSTYETKADAQTKLDTAKNYTDTAIANLVDSAPETLNTLNELAAALKDDADIVETLENSIATKANASDLTSHTGNTTVHITSSERSNWNAAYTHSQATHARTDATKVADSTTNGNILINGTETNVYTLPSAGSALGGVKSGGDVTISSGVITVNDDSHNHTISNIDNLQTSLDAKQATITGGATTITSSNLTANRALISNSSGKVGVSAVTSTELGYLDGVTSNVQTQLDGKAASSHTHNVLSVQSDNYKQGTDLPSTYPRGETIFFSNNPTNKFNDISYCTIHTIKGYNNMVCIQWLYPYNSNADTVYYRTALYDTDVWRDWKTVSVSDHTHNYAASSSAGGSATSAVKLDTSTAGGATQPVYFANGKPTACTYTLGKSVPSNAVFTDTNTKVTNTLATTTKAYITGTTSASTNTGTQVFDTGVYLDTTAGKLTADTFNGTTFSGSGIATVAEVQDYLGI